MATWRTIASSETDPNSPITSELMIALAENPVAIAEAESGATRIRLGAFERVTAGANERFNYGPEIETSASETGYIEMFRVTVWQGGTITVGYDMRSSGSSADGYVQRISAGTGTTFLSNSNATTWTTYSGDITITPGDILIWFARNISGTESALMRNLKISTGGEDIYPGDGMGGYIRSNRALT